MLVVGGGPAGLGAAIGLRQRGADVLVADARRPPIDKPCGEGLMPDARRELSRLGVELQPEHGREFRGILFESDEGRTSAKFPSGPGMGVRRAALQRLLVERAAELGVRMAWESPVTLRTGQPVRVRGVGARFRWLVGADGQASRVRAWAGLERGTVQSRRFGFRAHFRRRPWSEFVEIHWGKHGEAYVTPVGDDEICVAGIARRAGARLNDLLEGLPTLREKLAGLERTSTERGCVTLTRQLRRVTRGNVALVGDASGSVDAITGEGLGLGFRQALLLGESLEAGGLEKYEAEHAALLALPQRMARLMLLMDRFPALRQRAMRMMAARPELFRGLLAVHLGEQSLARFALRHGMEVGGLVLARRFAGVAGEGERDGTAAELCHRAGGAKLEGDLSV